MAKQFLDLWQKQLTKALTDPETVSSYMKLMGELGKTFTSSKSEDNVSADDNEKRQRSATQTSAVPPGLTDALLAQLTLRLSDIERRLDALEHQGRRKPGAAQTRKKTKV